MNYASAFLVLVLGACSVYWYISGRKFYTGPLIEAQAEEVASDTLPTEYKSDKDVV